MAEPLELDGPDAAGVLEVRLRSGQPRNRMTPELHRALARLWPALASRDDVRAVLLTGRPDGFSLGSDLSYVEEIATGPAHVRTRLLDEARAIVVGALDCELPVVAAVRGGAIGAALGVALLADVCVAADDALLADGHVALGVPAGDHAVLVWPLLCGMAAAKRRLLLPERLTGREAHEIGLVTESRPDAEVDARARDLAARLAAQAPLATAWTKRALHHWYRLALPAFESSLAHEMVAYSSSDARARVRAMREREEGREPPVASPRHRSPSAPGVALE